MQHRISPRADNVDRKCLWNLRDVLVPAQTPTKGIQEKMMAKQGVSGKATSSSIESHGLLRGLIDALHHLVMTVSARLRHTQIHGSPMEDAKGNYDIWGRLGSHVEQILSEHQPQTKSLPIREGKAKDPDLHEDTAATAKESNQLSEHGKRQAVNRLLPSMNQKLQRTTMEHINISLILAREGNTEGARLHIDLAESAIHTAGRFMTHKEYEIFEMKVEHRLQSIIEGNRPDDTES
jgi:hypothetical protein